MANNKSSSGNKKWLAAAGALAGVGASTFINFYCQGRQPNLTIDEKRRKEGICASNIEEPPRQVQKGVGYISNYGIVKSAVTASGNASVYPSLSPSPTPIS